MHTVLIADDNKQWLDVLEKGINSDPDFEVIAKVCDGRQAIELIETKRPDIVMLDIIMPEFDGAYIVRHIKTTMRPYDPIIYILSGIGTDTIIKLLNDLDIDFYSMKPVTLELVIQSLRKIVGQRELLIQSGEIESMQLKEHGRSPEEVVLNFVVQLGMPPHLLSTRCVVDSLLYFINDNSYLRMLTKSLYPEIARTRGISPASVEKNIRNAIAHMRRQDSELYQRLFSYTDGEKITNGQFLTVAAGYLRGRSTFGRALQASGISGKRTNQSG